MHNNELASYFIRKLDANFYVRVCGDKSTFLGVEWYIA